MLGLALRQHYEPIGPQKLSKLQWKIFGNIGHSKDNRHAAAFTSLNQVN